MAPCRSPPRRDASRRPALRPAACERRADGGARCRRRSVVLALATSGTGRALLSLMCASRSRLPSAPLRVGLVTTSQTSGHAGFEDVMQRDGDSTCRARGECRHRLTVWIRNCRSSSRAASAAAAADAVGGRLDTASSDKWGRRHRRAVYRSAQGNRASRRPSSQAAAKRADLRQPQEASAGPPPHATADSSRAASTPRRGYVAARAWSAADGLAHEPTSPSTSRSRPAPGSRDRSPR